jgi:hypothetical protein
MVASDFITAVCSASFVCCVFAGLMTTLMSLL